MPRTSVSGTSKPAAREGARKDTAQKVARGKRTRPSKGKSCASRKRVDSSGEESEDEAPPRKRKRVTKGKNADEEAILNEEGVVLVGDGEGSEQDGDGGEEDVSDGEIPDEMSDATLLST